MENKAINEVITNILLFFFIENNDFSEKNAKNELCNLQNKMVRKEESVTR